MHVPYVLTNLGKIYLTTYTVAYIRSLIYSVTSRATRFIVSVPAQEFHFSPTPQLNMQNVGASQVSHYPGETVIRIDFNQLGIFS